MLVFFYGYFYGAPPSSFSSIWVPIRIRILLSIRISILLSIRISIRIHILLSIRISICISILIRICIYRRKFCVKKISENCRGIKKENYF